MSDWQRTASRDEHNDALECGFYDLHLSALLVTDESDRLGNGKLFMASNDGMTQIALMYEE